MTRSLRMRDECPPRDLRPALKNTGTSGFSLTELLVVMGITAVLAALLGVGISSTRSSLARSVCASHIRTAGSTLLQYASDHNGVLSHVYGGSFTPDSALAAEASYWPNSLRELGYLKREQINKLECPSHPVNTTSVSERSKTHFGFYMADAQGQFQKDESKSGSVYRLRTTTHSSPATCIILADSLGKDGFQSAKIYLAPLYQSGAVHTRHGKAANLFFLDGHVEAAGPERLRELNVPGYYDEKGEPVLLNN